MYAEDKSEHMERAIPYLSIPIPISIFSRVSHSFISFHDGISEFRIRNGNLGDSESRTQYSFYLFCMQPVFAFSFFFFVLVLVSDDDDDDHE